MSSYQYFTHGNTRTTAKTNSTGETEITTRTGNWWWIRSIDIGYSPHKPAMSLRRSAAQKIFFERLDLDEYEWIEMRELFGRYLDFVETHPDLSPESCLLLFTYNGAPLQFREEPLEL